MRHLARTTTWTRSLAVGAVIALALGCASLPPAQLGTPIAQRHQYVRDVVCDDQCGGGEVADAAQRCGVPAPFRCGTNQSPLAGR